MSTAVYVWGTRAHWSPPPAVRTQLWLAHRLRNDLVRTWVDRDEAMRAIWSAHPDIAETETRIAELTASVEALAAAAAKERSAARTRRADVPSAAALRAAKAGLREAKAERRARIADVREQSKDAISAAYDAERAAVKALYGRYCQDGIPDRDGRP